MQPILFSFSGFTLYSLSVCIILAWLVFSFLFWRALRNQGVGDDRIFDLTFYTTLTAFIGARALFVILHWDLFSSGLLKIPALWVQPGLSWYGGLVSGLLTMLYLGRTYKVRVGYILDSLAFALPASMIVGLVGALLDGTTPGKLTGGAWGILYVGSVGRRHPVQVYEGIILLFVMIIVTLIHRRAIKRGLPYGVTGLWFFLLFTVSMFSVEFFKDTGVYFSMLTANQLILIALFAESIGAMYVRGGGREAVRPQLTKIQERSGGLFRKMYEKFSKRNS